MDTTIRPAEETDADALRGLDLRTWSPDVSPASREELRKPFFGERGGPADTLVAERDGALAGYVKLAAPTPLAASGHVLELTGLAVDPGHQRCGVGSRLVRAATSEAARRGARRLTLHVLAPNAPARALYAACGFVVEGVLRGEFELEGRYVDDVLMAVELPPASSSSVTG